MCVCVCVCVCVCCVCIMEACSYISIRRRQKSYPNIVVVFSDRG